MVKRKTKKWSSESSDYSSDDSESSFEEERRRKKKQSKKLRDRGSRSDSSNYDSTADELSKRKNKTLNPNNSKNPW